MSTIMLQHLTVQFSLCYLYLVAYGTSKAKENFKLLVLKVVAVAYEWWSPIRGSNYSDFAGLFLIDRLATGGSTVSRPVGNET